MKYDTRQYNLDNVLAMTKSFLPGSCDPEVVVVVMEAGVVVTELEISTASVVEAAFDVSMLTTTSSSVTSVTEEPKS